MLLLGMLLGNLSFQVPWNRWIKKEAPSKLQFMEKNESKPTIPKLSPNSCPRQGRASRGARGVSCPGSLSAAASV